MKFLLIFFLSVFSGGPADLYYSDPKAAGPVLENQYTVWVFLDPECPICQSYTRTLRTLHAQYASEEVVFRGIYDSPVIKKREIKRFHQAYDLPFAGEIDHDYALAKRWGATVTPEVVVTDARGEVLYRGAIDNWYYALGKNRPEPTEHYLQDALVAIKGRYPILKKQTEAVGCLMNR
ncbi:thioredoxin fold domain-containing protein [Salmonirosea aquatica]|uniref:thioredoxin fold domain-containing protein n=1 Tax=Salmonirosea aquatica TaxID=2654236 RepID=UPI00128E6094